MELEKIPEGRIDLKAVIVHPYLAVLGGGERVCFYSVKALLDKGWDVALVSQRLDEQFVEDMIGFNVFEEVEHIPYPNFNPLVNRFRAYQRTFHHLMAKKKLNDLHFELKLLTQDVGLNAARADKTVAYIHYPEFFVHLEENPNSFFWKAYYWPLRRYWMSQVRIVDLFIANSNYTRSKILNKWNKDAKVVYPPVETHIFTPSSQKEDKVISVGRITSSKRYENILEIAQEMPELKFLILGLKQDESYFKSLLRRKPSNVCIKTNVTRKLLVEELSSSKLYLHCMHGEHFGISVVEAMAAGCVPIVHDSGGVREIVTPTVGFRYTDLKEAITKIKTALEDEGLYRKLSQNSVKESAKFSVENFKKSLISFISTLG
ncbi:MAG: glycosyltransferase [Candidatus Bathyarchaeia archaeon]